MVPPTPLFILPSEYVAGCVGLVLDRRHVWSSVLNFGPKRARSNTDSEISSRRYSSLLRRGPASSATTRIPAAVRPYAAVAPAGPRPTIHTSARSAVALIPVRHPA